MQVIEFDIWEEDAPVILVANFPDFEVWEEDTPVLVAGSAGVFFIRRRCCEY